MAKLLMVVAPERFRDEELFETKAELDAAGHETILASTRRGICTGSRGGSFHSRLTIDKVNTDDFDGVVFVGGGGSKLLFANEAAKQIAQAMHGQGKLVAAICLAPVILANAGVLAGRKATVAGTEAKTLEMKGATYTGPGVTVDGSIVTANAPKRSRLFGQTINEVLTQRMPRSQDRRLR